MRADGCCAEVPPAAPVRAAASHAFLTRRPPLRRVSGVSGKSHTWYEVKSDVGHRYTTGPHDFAVRSGRARERADLGARAAATAIHPQAPARQISGHSPVSAPLEPVLGWRVWRLRGHSLASWGTTYVWHPNANFARCLNPNNPCPASPGRGCRCGFWAVFTPRHCISRVCEDYSERAPVLGLIRAWGEVALHGPEGFRAEYAAPVCLFSDWPGGAHRPAELPGRLAQLWQACKRFIADDHPLAAALPDLEGKIRDAAGDYGIPVLSLADACRLGALQEMGIDVRMVQWRD